ncbi:UNVERIFIED_CONTAM: hypothetical protein FKN15_007581 [Acipenser sinensis]
MTVLEFDPAAWHINDNSCWFKRPGKEDLHSPETDGRASIWANILISDSASQISGSMCDLYLHSREILIYFLP